MFWGKKKNTKDKQAGSGKNNKKIAGSNNTEKKGVGTSNSQRIREEALANARKAREVIGEDTIQRIAAAMTKKQQSAIEQAKNKIKAADTDRVVDEILYMLDDKE